MHQYKGGLGGSAHPRRTLGICCPVMPEALLCSSLCSALLSALLCLASSIDFPSSCPDSLLIPLPKVRVDSRVGIRFNYATASSPECSTPVNRGVAAGDAGPHPAREEGGGWTGIEALGLEGNDMMEPEREAPLRSKTPARNRVGASPNALGNELCPDRQSPRK
ncbi:hypothetical protein CFAM422_001469 [Trichoderma lentiforme]|uniref:Uncharacterized protein n=1 Tax=Trichoderma lentiforme TaxID=1567552 RepID=A0A9P4XNY5_9HYPO|nr:hypothetical protein CFAM422_001469 [Trichoderma lentiforme]